MSTRINTSTHHLCEVLNSYTVACWKTIEQLGDKASVSSIKVTVECYE